LTLTLLIESRSPGLSDSTSFTNLATSNLMLFSLAVVIDFSCALRHDPWSDAPARYAFDLRLIGGTKRCRPVLLSGV
jgi:hypothetical protein